MTRAHPRGGPEEVSEKTHRCMPVEIIGVISVSIKMLTEMPKQGISLKISEKKILGRFWKILESRKSSE